MNEKWSASNIPDLTGKVIIVTGGNSGIGFEEIKALSQKWCLNHYGESKFTKSKECKGKNI